MVQPQNGSNANAAGVMTRCMPSIFYSGRGEKKDELSKQSGFESSFFDSVRPNPTVSLGDIRPRFVVPLWSAHGVLFTQPRFVATFLNFVYTVVKKVRTRRAYLPVNARSVLGYSCWSQPNTARAERSSRRRRNAARETSWRMSQNNKPGGVNLRPPKRREVAGPQKQPGPRINR